MTTDAASFLTEYGESTRYTILEVIGKGSYGVVCSAVDNTTGASLLATDLLRLSVSRGSHDRRACGYKEDQRRV